jgi:NAD(P)-dependent dehydrogenase (short-subunit alcohol dehydrogenase family)
MKEEFINKVALITGASRGLGKSLSLELAKKGIETILVSRTVGALEELYDEIKKIGVNSTIVPLDLNDSNAIDNLGFEVNKKWKKLDFLISNAAITNELTPISHLKPDIWEKILKTNLTTNYRLIRSFEHLLKLSKNGKALFILDKETKHNKPFHIPYSVSKEGLDKLITIWAQEVSIHKIGVYSSYPPKMNTSLRKKIIPGANNSEFENPEIIAKKIIKGFINKKINFGKVSQII